MRNLRYKNKHILTSRELIDMMERQVGIGRKLEREMIEFKRLFDN